jgi:hypothetical protein
MNKWIRFVLAGFVAASVASAEVVDNGTRIQYEASAAQTEFDYPFEITADADLTVYVDGELQVLTTDYTVAGEGEDNGGALTFVDALDGGEIVTISRNTEIARETTFGQNAPLTSAAFNTEFDKLFVISQELENKIGRSLHLPETVQGVDFEIDPETFAGSYLTFDEDGEPQPATLSATTMTQDTVGALLYPRTTAEITAGVTPSDYEYPPLDLRRYGGAAADGSANSDQTPINSAVSVAEVDGGIIFLPAGTWNGCFSIDQPDVSIEGVGQQVSIIECDNGDGITLAYTTGVAMTFVRDLGIVCTQGTDNYGIKAAAHSTDSSVELYGLTVERTWITDCEIAFHARTLRNFALLNNWWQSVDKAIELVGKALVGRIAFNEFVFEDVDGANEDKGVYIAGYTYATGGFVAPEGILFIANQVYGFDVAIDIEFAAYVNILSNDIQATQYGLEFETVQHGLTIRDNGFDMGTASTAGIIGHGLGSEVETANTVIDGNRLWSSGANTAKAIVINDVANTNQYQVQISANLMTGFDTNDILLNNAGFTTVRDNRCNSADPTNSIAVTGVETGKGPIFIDGNRCQKALSVTAAEIANGEIELGTNVFGADDVRWGQQHVPTVASATAMAIGEGAPVMHVSGTTTITSIPTANATAWVGRTITLIFDGVLTFTDGSNLVLAGNFVTTAGDTITLTFDGTGWHEIARSVN